MQQKNLVIRRFGTMSFGIGYYENGSWVDHTTAIDADPGEADAVAGDRLADDIHAWYGCCGSGVAEIARPGDRIAVLPRRASEPWRTESTPAGDAVATN